MSGCLRVSLGVQMYKVKKIRNERKREAPAWEKMKKIKTK